MAGRKQQDGLQETDQDTRQNGKAGNGLKTPQKPPYILSDHNHSSAVSFARQVLGVDLWSKQVECRPSAIMGHI